MLRKILLAGLFLTFALSASAQTQNLFVQPQLLNAGSLAFSGAAVADFNGDGRLDIAYPNGTVLLANADGTYQTGTPWCSMGQGYCGATANTGIQYVLAGDFNLDGKQDLLVATSNFVWVLLGKGDGTFQAAVSSVTGSASTSPVIADFNGDGKPDVLLNPGNSGAITVCLGKGDGTFQAAITGPTMSSFSFVGVADLNGDHKVDILVTTYAVSPFQFEVFTGNGDGTFSNTPITTNPNLPASSTSTFDYVLADLDGDGKTDVVVSQVPYLGPAANAGDPTRQPQATFVCLGKGDGTFANATQIASRGGTIAVGDLNGDGVVDLVLTGQGIDVLLGTGGGGVALKESYFNNFAGGIRAVIADFNKDGKADVFTGNAVLYGNGDGTLNGNLATYFSTQGVPAVVGDFNQDGKQDIAVIGSDNTVDILNGDGTGRFTPGFASPVITVPAGGSFSTLNAGDVNGDGKTDLLVSATLSSGGWAVYLLTGNGDGTFNAPVAAARSSQFGLISVGLADLNNDHKLDLIVSDSSGAINIFLGNGDGTFTASNAFFGGVTTGVTLVTGDFNSDGKIDLVVGLGTGLDFLPGKGDGTFGTAVLATSSVGNPAVVGDFNGDGILDISGPSQNVVLGNGDGTFRFGSTLTTTVGPMNYTVGIDLNGDGKLDLVGSSVPQAGSDQVLQYALGNGDGSFTPVILQHSYTGFPFSGPIVGDFNGDGRPDIVFVYANSIVSMLNTELPATPDFTATATAPSTSTVSAGQSATFGLNVTPTGGFAQTVSFTCSGAPANSTCTVSPTSAMVSGTTAVPIKVTVATTASSSVLPMAIHMSPQGPRWPVARVVVTALLGILLGMAVGLTRSERKFARARFRWATAGCGLILVATSFLLTSCGGGSMQTSSQTTSGTATGSYTITVTGTAGSGASAVTHVVTFTLTVQ